MQGVIPAHTINLHGLSLAEARHKVMDGVSSALAHGERVVCIIHGQGKHSERFPVIKSFVRQWLEESSFAREHVASVFRGEDGSPYTRSNPGETVVVLKTGHVEETLPVTSLQHATSPRHATSPQGDEDDYERRKNAKGMRADRLRVTRRQGPRR